jgi:hypothetical protein
VCARWFEAAYRVVFFEGMMKKKTPPCLFTSYFQRAKMLPKKKQ